MKHKPRTIATKQERPAATADMAPQAAPQAVEDDAGRIVVRPDGYHWIALDDHQEFGPFETLEQARADMNAADERMPEPAETLQEAEQDIGIAGWIDPETGEPAEGQSPPHLEPE